MNEKVKCAVVVQAEVYRPRGDLQPYSICAWSESCYRKAAGHFLRVAWDLGDSLCTVLQRQLDTPEVPVQNPTLVFHFHCFCEAELTWWLLVMQRLILINHLQVSLLQMGS